MLAEVIPGCDIVVAGPSGKLGGGGGGMSAEVM